jgi:uncharacterized membrane protein
MNDRNDARTSDQVSVPHEQGTHIDETLIIHRSASELYLFWKNPANLPRVVPHLQRVELDSFNRGAWAFRLPIGPEVSIPIELVNEVPNEVIGWRSLDGSPVANAGAIRFNALSPTSTEVRLQAEYILPLGIVGSAVTKVLGTEPADLVRQTLANLKEQTEGRG